MTKPIRLLRFISIVFFVQTILSYSVSQAQITLDHVIIAVSNLDSVSQAYIKHGFKIKEGRLHSNGLLNNHIKFFDGTQLELMTLAGEPKDDIARGYSDLLKQGGGGAFIALQASSNQVIQASSAVGLTANLYENGGYRYVTFTDPGLENVFFIEYKQMVQDADSTLSHENGVVGIEEVWIEGGPKLHLLFDALNIQQTGISTSQTGVTGKQYDIGVIVAEYQKAERPFVLGVKLKTTKIQKINFIRPVSNPGIWIELFHSSQ